MHVESVAWASERKDVLYTFFFLLSMIGYIFYLRDKYNIKYILITLLFFLLSCFSKGQGVVLPIALLCIDYLIKRKINARMVVEKIPFLIGSLIFGIVAIKAQIQESAINSDYLTGAKIIFTGTYGLTMYLIRIILPINLSGAHPYPGVETGGFSTFIYITPIILLILIYLIFRSIKKNRYVLFGAMFFITCIIMVLKLIPLGDTIISERYTYLPYIGIFFVFGNYYSSIIDKFKQYKTLLLVSLGIVILTFSITTFQRCYVWRDTNSFWSDVAAKYPNYWRAPNNIAQGYLQKKDYENAVKYFTQAIECDKMCPPVPYMWRGQIYLDNLKKVDLAIADFKKVIDFPNKNDPSQLDARIDLGLAYYRNGQYDDALAIYNEALQHDPNFGKTYQLMALVYSRKNEYQKALDYYAKALQLNPPKDQLIEALINRGSMYTDVLGKYTEALADFKHILELDPGNTDAKMNTGITYYKMAQYDNAINIFNSALLHDYRNGKLHYLKAMCYGGKQDFADAVKEMNQAKTLGVSVDENQIKIWESKIK
jgi:tetratricopeptide (TPR) repeat protein